PPRPRSRERYPCPREDGPPRASAAATPRRAASGDRERAVVHVHLRARELDGGALAVGDRDAFLVDLDHRARRVLDGDPARLVADLQDVLVEDLQDDRLGHAQRSTTARPCARYPCLTARREPWKSHDPSGDPLDADDHRHPPGALDVRLATKRRGPGQPGPGDSFLGPGVPWHPRGNHRDGHRTGLYRTRLS